MAIPAKAFILDLDDTLIDVDRIKLAFEKNFQSSNIDSKILWETYDQVKIEKGFVDYQYLSEKLASQLKKSSAEIFNIFLHASFKNCLIPKSIELVEYLQTLGKVIIFSQGHTQLQTEKIKNSGLEQLVGKENIKIIEQKKEAVIGVIQDLRGKGFTQITFIDDRTDILDKAYSLDKNIQCYWIRNGKYKNQLPQTSCVTFQSEKLEEIYEFIYSNNTIEKIEISGQEDLQIKIGLSSQQVKQLITFTQQDKDVQKFTSDLKRFNNKKTFNNWLSKGKYIYSLVDSRDNLQGIVWFNEKDLPEDKYLQNIDHYKITLGIRTYGNARGKGLGKKLLHIALKHFKSTIEYRSITNSGFWSIISTENISSQKLHESIGFTQVTKPNQEGKIVMVYD